MSDARLTIYLWGLAPEDTRLQSLPRVWSFEIWSAEKASQAQENSLLLVASPDPVPAFPFSEQQILFIALDSQVTTRLLEEAWSLLLRSQLSQLVSRREKTGHVANAFFASTLAEALGRDLSLVRQAITHCLDQQSLLHELVAGPAWPASTSLALVVAATAQLVIECQSGNEESFRTRLREKSAQLPFKIRSELRLAVDRVLIPLWGTTRAA